MLLIVQKGTTPMIPTPAEYQAALKRAHDKGLEVTAIWDRETERTMWQVVNGNHSVHTVRMTAYGTLSCDCASRVYCCCRAAVHELLTTEREKRDARHAEDARRAAQRETAILMTYSNAAISIWK